MLEISFSLVCWLKSLPIFEDETQINEVYMALGRYVKWLAAFSESF